MKPQTDPSACNANPRLWWWAQGQLWGVHVQAGAWSSAPQSCSPCVPCFGSGWLQTLQASPVPLCRAALCREDGAGWVMAWGTSLQCSPWCGACSLSTTPNSSGEELLRPPCQTQCVHRLLMIQGSVSSRGTDETFTDSTVLNSFLSRLKKNFVN